ncbi:MAG: alpha/beta fold hydrolase [Bacteroidetes bacterium]|nr:alpha/beta fold hydrolase [Bacteroidota bacterium]
MIEKEQISSYLGYNGRVSLLDLNIPTIFNGKLIVFAHGFMGYKDWGAWQLVENYFLRLGFGFCKFNFSHNGTTPDSPTTFTDFEAFSINSYWTEYQDFQAVLNTLSATLHPFPEVYLIGHSQGGSMALLQVEDPRVKKIASWAAVAQLHNRFPKNEQLAEWEKDGFKSRVNGRTGQVLSQKYCIYKDFLDHENELTIKSKLLQTHKPLLFVHGTNDQSVPFSEMNCLVEWTGQKGRGIHGANHTFHSKEPWENVYLPQHLEEVCRHTAAFFLKSHPHGK